MSDERPTTTGTQGDADAAVDAAATGDGGDEYGDSDVGGEGDDGGVGDEHREGDVGGDVVHYETRVPSGAEPVVCDRCGRPLPEERLLVLHRGLEHEADLTDAEVQAFREAYEAERGELDRFRIVALGALVALYFGFLFTYAFVVT